MQRVFVEGQVLKEKCADIFNHIQRRIYNHVVTTQILRDLSVENPVDEVKLVPEVVIEAVAIDAASLCNLADTDF